MHDDFGAEYPGPFVVDLHGEAAPVDLEDCLLASLIDGDGLTSAEWLPRDNGVGCSRTPMAVKFHPMCVQRRVVMEGV
jgi:hypothetical protein